MPCPPRWPSACTWATPCSAWQAPTTARSTSLSATASASPSAWCTAMLTQRSEEHTSELQSPCNLVCRLLLEKKKKTKNTYTTQLQIATRNSAITSVAYAACNTQLSS